MALLLTKRRRVAAVTATVVAAAAVTTAGLLYNMDDNEPHYRGYLERIGGEEEEEGHGVEGIVGDPESESSEILSSITSVANARLAPYGSVAAGQLSSSLGDFRSLASNGSTWSEVTNLPYDADDPNYRDPNFSNSSGGAGYVAGRVTGLAAGGGYLFAGGANGGVFRKKLNNLDDPADDGKWQAISDSILSLSTGDLEYHDGALWYATGEANTGATSYVGAGVFRNSRAASSDLATAQFTDTDRLGGTELESRGINKVRFDDVTHWAYAGTTRGLWRYPLDKSNKPVAGRTWTNVFMPNPTADSNISQPYKNIVNDVAIDDAGGVLANAAWRNGDASYNGFYYSATGAPNTFTQVNPQGALGYQQVGNTEFAWGTDAAGKKSVLYAVVESPTKLSHSPMTVLYGVFKSASGTLAGPWTQIADSGKLQASGSALSGANGLYYRPGVQAWYNNFILAEPGHPDHVWLGLEEVYETTNGGSNWTTPGPYWNFGLKCWAISDAENTCPQTTHSDQHSVITYGNRVYVGNDGGVKSRPVNGTLDSLGHAKDWANHSQGLGTLQYYSVGVGVDPQRGGYAISGGLQDNGGSLLRGDRKDNQGNAEMVSPFGGDGGDIIVDSKNGCHILDEYVYLELWMTTTCGQTDGSKNAVIDLAVPDANPRFTAPFRPVRGSENTGDHASERWVAGGNSIWTHDLGFSTTEEQAESLANHGWTKRATLGSTGRMVVGLDAVADPTAKQDATKDVVVAAWCGESNCNSGGFTRGVQTNFGGSWHELDLTGLPSRYPSAVHIDSVSGNAATVYLVFNGYNRRFIEGPGAQQDHVWKGVLTKDGKVTWTNESAGTPDVPGTDVVRYGSKLVVGTDYGVMVGTIDSAGAVSDWKRIGGVSGTTGALPLTTVFDLTVGADGYLYAATHGRGIWKTPLSLL
ncbi:glycosyl hydrolase [Micromonospora globispora]|uniref:Glycosyl hydrolase n=1 Tax=Micromonospora globispora TaxID=1450148 RepID=A0A317KG67_9ACTN|nr:glycosyl hydrolase [Micromonospora globispora]PWU50602.1 glycosyl hydrolase [Micromonospora globispora]RQX05183.1 glycosyl hydrolase [Micromonospora globispora]